ncbi:MAG TPA: exodeoxyribonuclease VII large subunit [Ktedonobacterales bacterium]
MHVVAVAELTRYLKDLLAEDPYFRDVWVRGEISNYIQAASGHRYFALKDESAQLRCVLFRSPQNVVPPLRNGMAVVAHGRLSVYEQRGEYQLYVDAVEDAGVGLLHLRFEELKRRLEAEGLFDEARKRPLPPRPAVVGVVTSASGAALRDIVRVLRLRCPLVRVLLAPSLVQGEGAAEQIAAALDALNRHGAAEVILIARGGGSLEDLWAFNEEVVARAVARSRVPVVSGVGHETDFTIADFVADYRASTPTAGAGACVPDLSEAADALEATRARVAALALAQVHGAALRLAAARRDLLRASPQARVEAGRERTDDAVRALVAGMGHALALRGERLRGTALRLNALSPLLTLGRGYAVVRREPDGALVTSVAQVAPGQALSIRVADGSFAAVAGARDQAIRADVVPAAAEDGARRPRPPRGDATPAVEERE